MEEMMVGQHEPIIVNGWPVLCPADGVMPVFVAVGSLLADQLDCFTALVEARFDYSEPSQSSYAVLVGWECRHCGAKFLPVPVPAGMEAQLPGFGERIQFERYRELEIRTEDESGE